MGDRADWKDRISVNPGILAGKPAVKGTRMSVEFIVGLLGQGWTEGEVLENYPHLAREDILACLKYAEALMEEMKFYPLLEIGASSDPR